MEQFGFNNPILIDSEGVIVAGHGRFEAAKQLGLAKVPTIKLGHLTEAQRRAYVIADNKIGDMATYDTGLLAQELAAIKNIGDSIDLDGLGISSKDLDKVISSVAGRTEREIYTEGASEDVSAMSFTILNDDVLFPFEGQWELPEIRKDMLLRIPDKLSLWTYNRVTEGLGLKPPFLYNFGMDSTRGMEKYWDQTLVSFYTDDYKFERFWNDTSDSVKDLVDKNVMGAVSPNFTTDPKHSTTARQWHTYRSRYVARYMQESGLKIVPDVNCWWYQRELEHVVAGLVGCHTLSFQLHQNFTGLQRVRINEAIDYCIEEVKPDTVLLYAPSEALTLYPALSRCRVVRVEPNMKLKAQYRKMLDKRDQETSKEN